MKETVVCFGPGPQFKGGISNYNTSLAKALSKRGDCDVHIVSWTQQYPAIIPREFKDLKSKNDLLEGSNVNVKYITNYNNPLSWRRTVNYIKGLKPAKVIFQWSIALQGIPLSYITRKLARINGIEVILDLHFVIQKENSSVDKFLTKLGVRYASTYIVHALKTFNELKELFPKKDFVISENGKREAKSGVTVIKLFHPIYDLFKRDPSFNADDYKRKNGLKKYVFLYFGFIRKYKGLHNVIKAFSQLSKERNDVSLVICGESFWNTLDKKKWSTRAKELLFGLAKSIFIRSDGDEKNYQPLHLIDELGIRDKCLIFNEFIPNEEVHKYFQVSDCVLLFYLYATPSGIESLSYNFDMPIIATRVGHFPETIREGFNGYLAEPGNIDDMTKKMNQFIKEPILRENVRKAAEGMSWEKYAAAIMTS